MKKYLITYSIYQRGSVEVDAESEQEALAKLDDYEPYDHVEEDIIEPNGIYEIKASGENLLNNLKDKYHA